MEGREIKPPTQAELHALADVQPLDLARQEELEALMTSDVDIARRVADYRRLNRGLRDLYGHVVEEPVPQHLLPRNGRGSMRSGSARVAIAASLLIGLALGAAAGWWGRGATVPHEISAGATALARPAFVAHAVYTPEVLHPVEVGPDQRDHLVKWLSKRLGGTVTAPALEGLGYSLVGGRLLPDENGPAAQFMYQNEGGERLTLYVRRTMAGNDQTAFRFDTASDDLRAFTWIDGPFGYAVVGKVRRATLEQVARAVYAQIAP